MFDTDPSLVQTATATKMLILSLYNVVAQLRTGNDEGSGGSFIVIHQR